MHAVLALPPPASIKLRDVTICEAVILTRATVAGGRKCACLY
jgi:hypothetical protein